MEGTHCTRLLNLQSRVPCVSKSLCLSSIVYSLLSWWSFSHSLPEGIRSLWFASMFYRFLIYRRWWRAMARLWFSISTKSKAAFRFSVLRSVRFVQWAWVCASPGLCFSIKDNIKKRAQSRWIVPGLSRSSPTGFEEKFLMCLLFRGQNFFFKNLANPVPPTWTERFLFFCFFF